MSLLNPLVSAIMPVYNNQGFLKRCGDCFLRQDYSNLEWIVLDDSPTPVRDLLPTDPRIRYYYEPLKRNHGEKMNHCCELARGEIVIVWDSDDWYAPDRISRQVAPFADPGVLLTGTSRLYYYKVDTKLAYRYQNMTSVPWLAAFALRKSSWTTQKFEPIPFGADTRMIKTIPEGNRRDLNDLSLVVAAIHPQNASSKNLPNSSFIETPWSEIQRVTGGAL